MARYTTALRASPSSAEKEILHNNRALANLRAEAFDAALDDVSFIQNPQDRSEKALYRGALALYGLRRYKQASEILQTLVNKYPTNVPAKLQLNRCQTRLAEEKTGQYDFKALYEASKLRPPLMDNASYIGPVEMRESPGRGKGLFTTRLVKAGEMILCEKAFAYCFATPPEEMDMMTFNAASAKSSVIFDLSQDRVQSGNHSDLLHNVVNKLMLNPSLAPSFEDLYHGESKDRIASASQDSSHVLDT